MDNARAQLSSINKESYDKKKNGKAAVRHHRGDSDTSDFLYSDLTEGQMNLTDAFKPGDGTGLDITKAMRTALMVALKIKPTPQTIPIFDKFIRSLKIDSETTKELSLLSELVEPNARKRRRSANKLQKKE